MEKPTFSPFAQANGLVAQLEERLNGIEEVVSSNLIGSTNSQKSPETSGQLFTTKWGQVRWWISFCASFGFINDEDSRANNKVGAYLCAFYQDPRLYGVFWFLFSSQT
jgi:hypothetical protein